MLHVVSTATGTAEYLKVTGGRPLPGLWSRPDVILAAFAELPLRIAKAVSVWVIRTMHLNSAYSVGIGSSAIAPVLTRSAVRVERIAFVAKAAGGIARPT